MADKPHYSARTKPTVLELAKFLGCSKAHLESLAKAMQLRVHWRLSKREMGMRFRGQRIRRQLKPLRPEEVEALIEAHLIAPHGKFPPGALDSVARRLPGRWYQGPERPSGQ